VARIIDLDTVAPPDIEVVHQDNVYLLPGDIPVPNMLAIERAARDFFDTDSDEGATERLVGLQDEVLALFRIRQPDLEELPPLGMAQLVVLVRSLYDGGDVTPDPPRPAPKRSRGGTPSSTRSRKRTGSGSSRS
jgi:hypothetical protein